MRIRAKRSGEALVALRNGSIAPAQRRAFTFGIKRWDSLSALPGIAAGGAFSSHSRPTFDMLLLSRVEVGSSVLDFVAPFSAEVVCWPAIEFLIRAL
jgi:hypothetical protein